MIIRRDLLQGSAAWLAARASIPTASEMGNLLTPKFAIREGQMPATYLAQKIAEKLMGGPLLSFSSGEMEQGEILEDYALPWLALEYDYDIERVGMCMRDDGRAACSPDGIINGNMGLEIKCMQPVNHVKCLMTNAVPEEYLIQIHTGLYITGFQSWLFVAYHRKLPKFVREVKRSEAVNAQIHEALTNFLERFDEALERLQPQAALTEK